MDANIQKVAIFINKPNGFLLFSIVIHSFQTIKPSDSMIDVGNKIAGLQVVNFFQGKGFFAFDAFAKMKPVVPVENLVVGVGGYFQFAINKTCVYWTVDGGIIEAALFTIFKMKIVENGLQPLCLPGCSCKNNIFDSGLCILIQGTGEHLKILVKRRLGR